VLVICRDSDRAVVEPFLLSRYRPFELLSLAPQPNDVIANHVLRCVRTERIAFLEVGCESASPAWQLKSEGSLLIGFTELCLTH
jgi:hypothetical protein